MTMTGRKRLRGLMRPTSRLRYLAWRLTGSPNHLTVELQSGERLILRPPPTGDLSVAYEVFVNELYRPLRPIDEVRRIVDVGANVGFAVAYFARRFSEARLLAFEPHPAHLIQLQRNIIANDLTSRTTVVPAAAGVRDGRGFLSDAGEASRLFLAPADGRIEVAVTDFFDAVGDEPVDLLKMDCEGGELALIMDDRFGTLDLDTFVLEWHATREHPHTDALLQERLLALGFAIDHSGHHQSPQGRSGMLWAYRPRGVRPAKASA